MKEDERKEALENIAFIRDMVDQTQRDLGHMGSGWISICWGIFCFVGMAGQRLFIPHGPLMGVWWTGLIVVTILISYGIAKFNLPENQLTQSKKIVRWFLLFWLPLIVLAYTLSLFCVFLPGLSTDYIAVFMLLVVSTGYIMLGLMFFRDILIMGIVGLIGTISTAIFFLEYNDIILGFLFGTGLIVTGVVINRKWRKP